VLATLQTLLAIMPLPRLLRALRLGSLDELLTAPLTMIARLDDRDFLAQLEAVDDLRALIGEQARYVGTYFRSMVAPEDLAEGLVPVGHRVIDLGELRRPVLLVAGENDRVVPPRAVRVGARRLTAAETRLTTAPGGHLGVLAGRAAKDTTWARLCAFLDRHDAPATVEGSSPTSRRSLRPARLTRRRAVEPVRSTPTPEDAEETVDVAEPLPAITSEPEPEDPDSPTTDDPDVADDPAPAGTGSRSRPVRRSARLPAPKRASRTPRRR
jgi:polyhydroxyalkanoate synthase